MNAHQINKNLLILALIGLFLYFITNQISAANQDDSFDQGIAAPMVTQAQATDAAVVFLHKQFSATASRTFTIYESNKALSIYVQKNHLGKTYSDRFAAQYPLDFWKVHVWDEALNQSYIVDIDMNHPSVVGWDAVGLNTLGDKQQALSAANLYLQQMGYDLTAWKTTEQESRDQLRIFIFENLKNRIGDAKQQLTVAVSGLNVRSFHGNFAVPSVDLEWAQQQDSNAQIMYWISILFMLAFAISAIFISFRKRKQISFKRGFLLAMICMVINSVSTINAFPSAGILYGDPSTLAFQQFYLILSLGINFLMSVTVYFALIAGLQLWREKGWNPLPRWKDADFGKKIIHGMGRGYLICFFVIGVQQVLFLFAGGMFHSFSINDPSQSEYNLLWPGVFPTMAWMAGISEEIIYRLFAIVLMQSLFKNRFVSILLPSIAWALGHAAYSVYPSYTRLFEVTVLGIIFSCTFLKYGLITALFTHAIMDSMLMGLSLILTFNTVEYSFIGLFYIILPALVGLLLMLLKQTRPPGDLKVEKL